MGLNRVDRVCRTFRIPVGLTKRSTYRPLSGSFLGLPYRILNISHKKELLRGLWVALPQGLWASSCKTLDSKGSVVCKPSSGTIPSMKCVLCRFRV